MFSLILLVFALVFFVVAAFATPVEPWRWRLLCLGLACVAGALIVHGLPFGAGWMAHGP